MQPPWGSTLLIAGHGEETQILIITTDFPGLQARELSDAGSGNSVDSLVRSALDGWRIDETLVIWSGGTALAPLPVGDASALSIEPLLRTAAARATLRPDPLRCFTVPFWRSARPDLTPVFAWSRPAPDALGPFVPAETAVARWRLSVLAALAGLAGGPALVLPRGDDIEAAAARLGPAPATELATLTDASSVDDVVQVLAALEGSHDQFPAVVAAGAVVAAAEQLAEVRGETHVVGSMQVLWSATGRGFLEDDSFSAEVELTQYPRWVRLVLPNLAFDKLRLDPIDQQCRLAVNAIRVVVDGEVVASYDGGRLLLEQCPSGSLELDADDDRVLVATTDDPHVELDVSLVEDRGVERFIEVEIAAAPPLFLISESVPDPETAPEPAPPHPGETPVSEPATPEVLAIARMVDLSEWFPAGFVDVDGWSLPTTTDPQLNSPRLDSPPTPQLVVRMAVRSPDPVTASLYFAAAGGAFSEAATLHFHPSGDGELRDYVVDVPDFIGALPRSRVRQIRFDPVDDVTPFHVESIKLIEKFDELDVAIGQPLDPLVHAVGGRPAILSVGRTNYLTAMGGSERRIRDEAEYAQAHGFAYVHVWPMVMFGGFGDRVELKLEVCVDGTPYPSCTSADVAATLGHLAVAEVRVQHLMGWTWPALGSLLNACDAPIRYCVHDFFAICPEFTLLRNGRDFCGAPAITSTSCTVCRTQPIRLQVQPRVEALLHSTTARLTIQCPSESAAQLYRDQFPALADRVVVHPHEHLLPAPAPAESELPERLRIAFVGVAADHKGWKVWCRLRTDPRLLEQYEFVHVGMSGVHDNDRVVVVDFRSDGPDAMERTLRDEDIHVALVWSQWPETFSFTTIESIAAGCLLVVPDSSGNAAHMVRDHDAGVVLPNSEDALVNLLLNGGAVRDLVTSRRQAGWRIERDPGPLPTPRSD